MHDPHNRHPMERLRGISPTGRVRPSLVESWPKLAKAGQAWSNFEHTGPKLVESCAPLHKLIGGADAATPRRRGCTKGTHQRGDNEKRKNAQAPKGRGCGTPDGECRKGPRLANHEPEVRRDRAAQSACAGGRGNLKIKKAQPRAQNCQRRRGTGEPRRATIARGPRGSHATTAWRETPGRQRPPLTPANPYSKGPRNKCPPEGA